MNQSREAHLAARPHHSPAGHAKTLFSERGGRSSGRLSGLYDDPHRRSLTSGDHSSSRLAPLTPTPVAPVTNLTAGSYASKVGPTATIDRSADCAGACSR
jgi:hypothetical protein